MLETLDQISESESTAVLPDLLIIKVLLDELKVLGIKKFIVSERAGFTASWLSQLTPKIGVPKKFPSSEVVSKLVSAISNIIDEYRLRTRLSPDAASRLESLESKYLGGTAVDSLDPRYYRERSVDAELQMVVPMRGRTRVGGFRFISGPYASGKTSALGKVQKEFKNAGGLTWFFDLNSDTSSAALLDSLSDSFEMPRAGEEVPLGAAFAHLVDRISTEKPDRVLFVLDHINRASLEVYGGLKTGICALSRRDGYRLNNDSSLLVATSGKSLDTGALRRSAAISSVATGWLSMTDVERLGKIYGVDSRTALTQIWPLTHGQPLLSNAAFIRLREGSFGADQMLELPACRVYHDAIVSALSAARGQADEDRLLGQFYLLPGFPGDPKGPDGEVSLLHKQWFGGLH
jgi:hypothetical protein